MDKERTIKIVKDEKRKSIMQWINLNQDKNFINQMQLTLSFVV